MSLEIAEEIVFKIQIHTIFKLDLRVTGKFLAGWPQGRRKCLGALVNSAQEPPAKGPVGLGLELPTTGLGRSPGEGKGYPLHYFGLEKSMDRIVHGVSKSRT